jgi:serine phosphatase RsbU (regulator of sigma subunit)
MAEQHLSLPAAQRMQCMEVWGGNRPTDSAFEMPGLRVWLFSRPHLNAKAGGDVYYLSSCASGRITRLLLADVSGHGDSAAKTAVALRDIMRQNINRIDQSRFVASMNDKFSDLAKTSGVFATAIVSTFFSPTRNLAVCLAGHPPPLYFRRATGHWSELNSHEPRAAELANLPLGVTPEVHYSEFNVLIDRGDLVLLYSDGLSESRNQSDEVLSVRGLRALLETLDASQPDRFIPDLHKRIEGLSSQNLESDDMTAILVEATASPVPIVNNILAPVRLIRSLFETRSNEMLPE